MIEIICNRDMGDEHVERRDINVYTNPRSTLNVHHINQYLCSSDRFDHTHVYAHGDAGDRAGE